MPDSPDALRLRREVPVRHDVDVFVAGGGPAGVAGAGAAMAAAGEGAPRAIDIPHLQQRLRTMGAYLPDSTPAA